MPTTRSDAAAEPGALRSLIAFAHLIRLNACVTAAVGVLVGAWMTNASPVGGTALLSALVVVFIAGAGNALNDLHDVEIDRINRADRPLPSGQIRPEHASALVWILFGLGLVLTLWLSWWCLVIAVVNSGLLVSYAYSSKKLAVVKNLLIGYLVGSVFLFGALQPQLLTIDIVVLAMCAAMATFAREIVKDIEDIHGDRENGAATLPIIIGAGKANRIAYLVLVLAVLFALVPFFIGTMRAGFVFLLTVGALVFAASWRIESPSQQQKAIMAGSIVQLAAFVVGHLG